MARNVTGRAFLHAGERSHYTWVGGPIGTASLTPRTPQVHRRSFLMSLHYLNQISMQVSQREGPLVAQPPFIANTGISDRFQVKSIRSSTIYMLVEGYRLAVGGRMLLAFRFCVPCRCDEAAAPCLHPSIFTHTLFVLLPYLLLPPDKPGCKGLGTRNWVPVSQRPRGMAARCI